MWTNGDDFNDEGDRVRLYQPIAYSSGRSHFSQDDPTNSYIGGGSTAASTFHCCATCQEPMEQLVQLHVPPSKTFYVLGCNQAKCVNGLFTASKFSMGGGGVFYAERKEAKPETMAPPAPEAPAEPKTSTNSTEKEEKETNDWMVDSDEEDNDDDLEQQVAAMELKAATQPKANPKPKKKKEPNAPAVCSCNNLPCFELHSLLEPPGKQPSQEEDEDDLIGAAGASSSDAKIQQMLARYMAEEDDPDILAALQGTAEGSASGGAKSREKDERLKASDRALLAFKDRIQRSPRQVLRYAPNGMPLWSIPRPQSSGKKGKKKSKVNFAAAPDNNDNNSTAIPPCACGAERRFEFQLMPSLLHVLQVDKHASTGSDDDDNNLEAIMSADYGGMNWGALAVYSCPNDNCTCGEDYLVVQASVDETPCKRAVADAPVFIKENQTFDALTNEGDELEGCNDDDDDEDTVADESDLVFTLDG